MKNTKQQHLTKKRCKAQLKRVLAWATALGSVLTVVKLLMEIISMLR